MGEDVDVVVGVKVVVVDVAVDVGGVDGGDSVVAPLPPPLLLPLVLSSLRGCQLVCSVHVEMLVLGRVRVFAVHCARSGSRTRAQEAGAAWQASGTSSGPLGSWRGPPSGPPWRAWAEPPSRHAPFAVISQKSFFFIWLTYWNNSTRMNQSGIHK